MSPKLDFIAMSSEEIAASDTSAWIAVLPLGAHEQHGPHLPFETDTIIAEGVARRLAKSVTQDIPVTVLPVEPVGYSIEHMDYEGSHTLTFDEAVNKWVGLGESLAKQGIRKMLLLNAHGGNSPLLTIVATELRVRCNMLCVATSWTRFIKSIDVVSDEEKAIGIHGGDIETSVMLALDASKVDLKKAENFSSKQAEFATSMKHLRAYGPHAFGWKMQDLNPKGVTGNASLATAGKGEALLNKAVEGLTELVTDIHHFDMSILDQ